MRLLRHILVYQEKNERKNEMNKKCPHCGCCVCGIEPDFHCFDCKKILGHHLFLFVKTKRKSTAI